MSITDGINSFVEEKWVFGPRNFVNYGCLSIMNKKDKSFLNWLYFSLSSFFFFFLFLIPKSTFFSSTKLLPFNFPSTKKERQLAAEPLFLQWWSIPSIFIGINELQTIFLITQGGWVRLRALRLILLVHHIHLYWHKWVANIFLITQGVWAGLRALRLILGTDPAVHKLGPIESCTYRLQRCW